MHSLCSLKSYKLINKKFKEMDRDRKKVKKNGKRNIKPESSSFFNVVIIHCKKLLIRMRYVPN